MDDNVLRIPQKQGQGHSQIRLKLTQELMHSFLGHLKTAE